MKQEYINLYYNSALLHLPKFLFAKKNETNISIISNINTELDTNKITDEIVINNELDTHTDIQKNIDENEIKYNNFKVNNNDSLDELFITNVTKTINFMYTKLRNKQKHFLSELCSLYLIKPFITDNAENRIFCLSILNLLWRGDAYVTSKYEEELNGRMPNRFVNIVVNRYTTCQKILCIPYPLQYKLELYENVICVKKNTEVIHLNVHRPKFTNITQNILSTIIVEILHIQHKVETKNLVQDFYSIFL